MGKACPPCPLVLPNPQLRHFYCQTLFKFALSSLSSLSYNPTEVSDTFRKRLVLLVLPVLHSQIHPTPKHFRNFACPPCPTPPPPPRPNPLDHPKADPAPPAATPLATPSSRFMDTRSPHTCAHARPIALAPFPPYRRALFVFPFAVHFSFWVYTIFEIVFNSRFSFSFRAFISIIKYFLFFSQHFRTFRRTKCPPLFATLLQKMSQCRSRAFFLIWQISPRFSRLHFHLIPFWYVCADCKRQFAL